MPADPVKPVSQESRSAQAGIFTLELIGAGHEEPVDAGLLQAGAERRDTGGAELGRGGDIEGLEHERFPGKRFCLVGPR